MLTDKTEKDFNAWFFKNWGVYPGNIFRDWLEDDVMKCLSLFFGYTVNTINKVKKANLEYNSRIN